MATNVTVWGEFRAERHAEDKKEVYPDGVHTVVAEGLEDAFEVRTATLDEPEHGLREDDVEWTDVLFWYSHGANDEVSDEVVDRVQSAVLDGMGLIALHSACRSRVFSRLLGTTGDRGTRGLDERKRVWVVDPGHRIVDGFDQSRLEFEAAQAQTEPFDVPDPEELVLISWLEGGDVFRAGCCWRRGNGRIFYFGPGHETYPIYYRDDVRQILRNGVRWAAPTDPPHRVSVGHDDRDDDPLEEVEPK